MRFVLRASATAALSVLAAATLSATSAEAASAVATHGADWGQIQDQSAAYPNKIVVACDRENDNHAVWAQYHRITSAGGSVYDYVADTTGVDSTCGRETWHGSIWRVRAVRMCEEVPNGPDMFADCGSWKYA